MPTISVKVSGKVQGVFYRASAQNQARSLGLTGWVKNEPDGTVLIQATGSATALKTFTEWCAAGPADAQVANVQVTPLQETPFEAFRILR